MHLILLIAATTLIKLTSTFTNPKCLGKRYHCGDQNQINVCVNVSEFTNKQHLLQNCPTGTYCPTQMNVSFGSPIKCTPIPTPNLTLPGEICQLGADCLSGTCNQTDKTCVGNKQNAKCVSHEDCDPQLFCDPLSTCQPQKNFDEICTNDFQCMNNCICNLGKCTYFYSLENGIPADNPKACYYGYINQTNSTCAYGPKSEIKARPCEKDGDCLLLNKDGHLAGNSTCQCGYNPGSFSYCSLSEGDDEYLQTINLFQWILYTNINCHTVLRYGPCRFLYSDEVTNYQRAIRYYNMLPEITFNDNCIREIYTASYWKIDARRIGVVLLLLSAIAI